MARKRVTPTQKVSKVNFKWFRKFQMQVIRYDSYGIIYTVYVIFRWVLILNVYYKTRGKNVFKSKVFAKEILVYPCFSIRCWKTVCVDELQHFLKCLLLYKRLEFGIFFSGGNTPTYFSKLPTLLKSKVFLLEPVFSERKSTKIGEIENSEFFTLQDSWKSSTLI